MCSVRGFGGPVQGLYPCVGPPRGLCFCVGPVNLRGVRTRPEWTRYSPHGARIPGMGPVPVYRACVGPVPPYRACVGPVPLYVEPAWDLYPYIGPAWDMYSYIEPVWGLYPYIGPLWGLYPHQNPQHWQQAPAPPHSDSAVGSCGCQSTAAAPAAPGPAELPGPAPVGCAVGTAQR